MKGQATLTVKDKLGNIKSVTTKDNVVFDIPKHILQNTLTYGLKYSSYGSKLPTGNEACNCVKYFNTIFVNDVESSITDPFEFLIPKLTGGITAKLNTSFINYTQYSSEGSSVVDNTIVRKWVWADLSESFSIKSLNLHHELLSEPSMGATVDQSNTSRTRPYPFQVELENGYFIRESRILSKHTDVVDIANGAYKYIDVRTVSDRMYGQSITASVGLYKLKNNEYALFSQHSDVTTTTFSSSVKYLHIIKIGINGIELQRTFALDDFITGADNTTLKMLCASTIGTKNYIYINKSTSVYGIFEIPDTQTTPAPALTGSEYVGVASYDGICAVANGFICNVDNYVIGMVIDTSLNTVEKRIRLFNCNTPCLTGQIAFLKDAYLGQERSTYIVGCDSYNIMRFANTTALNFDTPIAVTAGDTLSIVYTITAT